MSTRFEILKNGERVCVSGINGNGVLCLGVTSVQHKGEGRSHSLHVGGLGKYDGSQEQQHHAAWSMPEVCPGDEITIRILSPGEFDEPHEMTGSPRKTIDDPDFGKLSYYVNAWDAEIEFNSSPIESAHIHIRADESGPSAAQRQLILSLRQRHPDLWSPISEALVRCHREIATTRELEQRLSSRIGIDPNDDPDMIEVSYRVQGDPDFGSYHVTLRNWEIVEVGKAH